MISPLQSKRLKSSRGAKILRRRKRQRQSCSGFVVVRLETLAWKKKGIFKAWLRCPIESKRMALAEKSPPGPDTPLAHRRPGYPLAGCFPAEPAAVSPGSGISSEFDDRNQPLDIGVMPSKIHRGIVPRFLRQGASATTKRMNPLSWVAGEARTKDSRH